MTTIKLHDVLWRAKNAGASPDGNRRTELYFAGCQKAMSGNPCKNCFNPRLWDNTHHLPHEAAEIADTLDRHEIPRYITIVGGEPTDQLDGLRELIPLLHRHGYEMIMFTWHNADWVMEHVGCDVLARLSYTICGPYDETRRIYDTTKDDGIHNAIGSDNQTLLFCKEDGSHSEIPVYKVDRIEYRFGRPYLVGPDGTEVSVWNR